MWKIFYDDGSAYRGDNPELAPGVGVLAIVQPDDHVGRTVLCRWDWYVYHVPSGRWWGCDLFGLLDNLTNKPQEFRAVKAGRTVTRAKFEKTLARAKSDPEFPVITDPPRAEVSPDTPSKG